MVAREIDNQNGVKFLELRHNFWEWTLCTLGSSCPADLNVTFSSTGMKWSKEKPLLPPSFPLNLTEAGFTAKITLPRFPSNAKYV